MSEKRVKDIVTRFRVRGVEAASKALEQMSTSFKAIAAAAGDAGKSGQQFATEVSKGALRAISSLAKVAKAAKIAAAEVAKIGDATPRISAPRAPSTSTPGTGASPADKEAARQAKEAAKAAKEVERAAEKRSRAEAKAAKGAQKAADAIVRAQEKEAANALKAAQKREKAAEQAAAAEIKATEKAAKESERTAKQAERLAERKAKAETRAAEASAKAAERMHARMRTSFAGIITRAGAVATAIGGIGTALGLVGVKRSLDDTIEDMKTVREIAALTNSKVEEISFIQSLGAQSGLERDDIRGILSGANAAFTEAVRDPTSEFGKAFRDAGVRLTVTPQLDKAAFEREYKSLQVSLDNMQKQELFRERNRLTNVREANGKPLDPVQIERLLQNKRITLGTEGRDKQKGLITDKVTESLGADAAADLDIDDVLDDAAAAAERMERAFRAAQPPARRFINQFFALAAATDRMGQAEKGRFLSQLLGDDDSAKVAELLETISANRDRLGPLYQQLLETDQLITEQQVETAKQYQRQTGVLSQAVKTVQRLYFVRVAPELGKFFDTATKFLVTNADAIVDYLERGTRTALDFAHDLVEVFTDLDVDAGKAVRFTWLQDFKDAIPGAIESVRAFGRDLVRAYDAIRGVQGDEPEAETGFGGAIIRAAVAVGPAVQFVVERVQAMVEGVKARFDDMVSYVRGAWATAQEIFASGGSGKDAPDVLSGFFLLLIQIKDLIEQTGAAFKAVFVDGQPAPDGFKWMERVRDILGQIDALFQKFADASKLLEPIVKVFDRISEAVFGVKAGVALLAGTMLNVLTGGLLLGALKKFVGLIWSASGITGAFRAAGTAATAMGTTAGAAATAAGTAATTAATAAGTAATTASTAAATAATAAARATLLAIGVIGAKIAVFAASAYAAYKGIDYLAGDYLEKRNHDRSQGFIDGSVAPSLAAGHDKRQAEKVALKAEAEKQNRDRYVSGGYDFSRYQGVSDVRTHDFGGPVRYGFETDALASYSERKNRFDLSAAQIDAANVAIDGKIQATVDTIDATNAKLITDLVQQPIVLPDGRRTDILVRRDQADALRLALDTSIR